MQNEKLFIERVKICSKIRAKINTVLHSRMGKLALLYEYITGDERSNFKMTKDMLYYVGGWPSENTPPRMESIVKRISGLLRVLTYIDRSGKFEKYCREYGITITLDNPMSIVTDESKLNRLVNKEFPGEFDGLDSNQIVSKAFDMGITLQSEICALADEIKVENGAEILIECGVSPSSFSKSVNIKHALELDKDKGNKRALDITDGAVVLKDAIDTTCDI